MVKRLALMTGLISLGVVGGLVLAGRIHVQQDAVALTAEPAAEQATARGVPGAARPPIVKH